MMASPHVADLLARVERLADTDLQAEAHAGRAAAAAAVAGVLAGTTSKTAFVAAFALAATRPALHDETPFLGGFAEELHRAILRGAR
jgi:hypothetical protein